MGDDVFDSNGVAVQNPHLRRVTEIEPTEPEVEDSAKGVYFTMACSNEAFTISVDGPGTFTFDTQDAKGVIGIEWVGDE